MDLIGVVHLLPLPGSPKGGTLSTVMKRALYDAKVLRESGIQKVIVENFGDAPFYKDQVPPHVVSMMTHIIQRIQDENELTIGVNVLRNDALSALAIAATTGGAFVRINVLSGAAWTDQGYIEGRAIETLLYRERLKQDIILMADVKVKHAVPTGSSDVVQLARELYYRAGADQLIVTGEETGRPCKVEDLMRIHKTFEITNRPKIYVGSGVTPQNITQYKDFCDGCIVGTYFHKDGDIQQPLDTIRVRDMITSLDA